MRLPLNLFLWKDVFQALTRMRADPACWLRDASVCGSASAVGRPLGKPGEPSWALGAGAVAVSRCLSLYFLSHSTLWTCWEPHGPHSFVHCVPSYALGLALPRLPLFGLGASPSPDPQLSHLILTSCQSTTPRPAGSASLHGLATLIRGQHLPQTSGSQTRCELSRLYPQHPPRVIRFAASFEQMSKQIDERIKEKRRRRTFLAQSLLRCSHTSLLIPCPIKGQSHPESEIPRTCKIQGIVRLHEKLHERAIIIFLLPNKVNQRPEILMNVADSTQLING